MDLFLIRHAKSSWTDESLRDIDRPLNKRGRRQVEAMAGPLLAMGALDGAVHVSHACRARETIEGIVDQLPDQQLVSRVHFDPDLYTFRFKALLKWLRSLDSQSPSLTLIGHNPALSDLAAALTNDEVPDMATGAVLHLEVPVNAWRELRKGQCRLKQYLPPARASYQLFRRRAPSPPKSGGNLKQQVPVALQHQLALIRALQPGVIQGADPEFLHQFRVNLRRTRAVTEAIITITGEDRLRKAVKPLKAMARQTSMLRDLDVFLDYLDNRATEDPRVRRSLQASGALETVRHWQAEELQSLRTQLERKAWHKALTHWEQTIGSKALTRALGRTTPDAIHETVGQRGQRCQDDFRDLSGASTDEAFHALRKALKRLRYLAELDKDHYRELLSELKTQQERYGEFQDRHQQEQLLATLAESRMDRRLPPVLADLSGQVSREKDSAREAILANPPHILRG